MNISSRYSIHWHRPGCLPSRRKPDQDGAPQPPAAPNTRTVFTFGFFKLKQHSNRGILMRHANPVPIAGTTDVSAPSPSGTGDLSASRVITGRARAPEDTGHTYRRPGGPTFHRHRVATRPETEASQAAGEPNQVPIDDQATKDELIAAWKAWAKNGSSSEQRQTAVKKLEEWFRRGPFESDKLDLSHLDLCELPPLPKWVKALDVSHNHLRSLPELPSGVQRINAKGNQLATLPALPDSVIWLNVADNSLKSLPKLNVNLQRLYAARNRLRSAPDFSQAKQLSYVGLDYNQLTTLPSNMPASIKWLNVSYNFLHSLPDDLPQGMEVLNVSSNLLKRFPSALPEKLDLLDAVDNPLEALPAAFPQNMRLFLLTKSVSLPDHIAELPPKCQVEWKEQDEVAGPPPNTWSHF